MLAASVRSFASTSEMGGAGSFTPSGPLMTLCPQCLYGLEYCAVAQLTPVGGSEKRPVALASPSPQAACPWAQVPLVTTCIKYLVVKPNPTSAVEDEYT
jgi:hypothetical protein